MKSQVRSFRGALAFVAVALVTLAGAGPAQAAFGVRAFDGQVSANPAGDPYTQAGGHPYEAWSQIDFSGHIDPSLGFELPDADARTIRVDLPAGLVGNPSAVQKCTRTDFFSPDPEHAPDGTACPLESQVGMTYIELVQGVKLVSAVWNLTPSPGSPATFGLVITGIRILANASVRTGGDYGITLTFPEINQGVPILSTKFTLWGNPPESSHDFQRCSTPDGFVDPPQCTGNPGDAVRGPNSVVDVNSEPFITNPTACTAAGVGLPTNLTVSSWQNPGVFATGQFISHLPPAIPAPPASWGPPQGPTGCEALPFAPEMTVAPTSREAGAPTGLDVTLKLPQDGLRDPHGLATAHLKRATVTLPEGMALNPAVAEGLSSCLPSQIALNSEAPSACPDSSRIGSVAVKTPLLERELEGGIYLAKQRDNPFGSLLAIYVLAEDEQSGVTIKLAGEVSPDPASGRLVTTFDDNPQLPFETFRLRFNGGQRAPLVNPPNCGTYTTHAALSSWSRPGQEVGSDSSFVISAGCGRASGFTPGFEAGTSNPVAGADSAFSLRVTRSEGQANLARIEATLPEGLLAKLAGVPVCADAAAASGACPAASQVGTATVATGAGPNPVFVPQAGKEPTGVYLAGSYRGAPYSLVVKVPAQAGPFDLGTVTVRNALRVDPVTTQVSTSSDPLPQILEGIPLGYRDVRIEINRPEFTRNPTSCALMQVSSVLAAASGATAKPASRFQVEGCASLDLKPKLAFRFSGAPTRRGGHPKLTATLTTGKEEANLRQVRVTLPKTEFLENAHIRTVCTRVQYAASKCPAKSVYGYARAWTPLLDKPLEGPVYLRSSSHTLPDLVASLDGQIHVDLAGRIDSVRKRIRNTFETVPDAPVTKFVLTMQGGGKGLLSNNTNLCKAKPRAHVEFDGQNGKLHETDPLVTVAGCRGGKGKRK